PGDGPADPRGEDDERRGHGPRPASRRLAEADRRDRRERGEGGRGRAARPIPTGPPIEISLGPVGMSPGGSPGRRLTRRLPLSRRVLAGYSPSGPPANVCAP